MTIEPDNLPVSSPKKRIPPLHILFVVISLLGFVFYAVFNKQVFPAASIDMQMTQSEAGEKSKQLAAKLGYDVEHALHSTTFTTAEESKTVLEFKLGIEKANELMKSQVPVWLWRTRYCKELIKDEVYVDWTTHGQFKAVFHYIENDKKIPTISKDEALALAKDFVAKTGGIDLAPYELFESGSEKLPNRTDHHFTWRKPGFTESEFRIKVEIAGNEVATYNYWLAPTDTWTREYTSIRQYNELLGKIASFLIILLIVATVGAFIYGLTQHKIRWRFALIASGIVALLVLLEGINNFNYTFDSYDTSVTFSQFVISTVFREVLLSVGAFVFAVLMAGGADVVYRSTRPNQTAIRNLFSLRGMAQQSFAKGVWIGSLLVGLMMCWEIGYYKLGQHFGFFCPLGVDDYRVLGNFMPAVSGALIGIGAAGLEEFSCRVVGLGLLERLTKNFWIANLLQAAIWGFAHSQYPQQPCYARGIELTFVGLIFGYIVKQYGVLPCLIAHYLYDAFLTVEPVFSSHNPLLIIPSVLILLPFIAAVWLCRRWAKANNVAAESEDLSNASDVLTTAIGHGKDVHAPEVSLSYAAIPSTWRKLLILIAVLGLAVTFVPSREQLGKSKQLSVSASQAVELSKKYLTEDGYSDKDYLHAAQLIPRPDDSQDALLTWQYVYEKLGYERTVTMFNQMAAGVQWNVRYMKPNVPGSFEVCLKGDGTKRGSFIDDIDQSPGAKLDEASALLLAEAYIKKNRPDFVPFELATKTKIAQTNRVDYKFDFSLPKLAAGDTPALLHAEVKGDKISNLNFDWNVPDQWLWPRRQLQSFQQVDRVIRNGAMLALVVAALLWSVHLMRATSVPWRFALTVGALGFALTLIGILNGGTSLLYKYNTAEGFESFVGQAVAEESTKLLMGTLLFFLVSIVGLVGLKHAFPSAMQQLRGWVLLNPADEEQRRIRMNIFIDAAISTYALLGVVIAIKSIQQALFAIASPNIRVDVPTTLSALYCTQVPLIEVLTHTFLSTLSVPLFVVIGASFWQRYVKSQTKSLAMIIVIAIVFGISSWYWQDCVINVVCDAVKYIAVWLLVRKAFGVNVLAYVFAATEMGALYYFDGLISHASQIAGLEIGVLSVLIALPAILALSVWWIDRTRIKAA